MLVVVVRVAELRRDHVQRHAVFQHDSRVAVACAVQRDRRDACGHHEPHSPAYAAKQEFEQALNVAIATPGEAEQFTAMTPLVSDGRTKISEIETQLAQVPSC
jgi:hypothetical protein